MQVNIDFGRCGIVFIALFVQNVGSFTVSFSHQVVFVLTAEAKRFGGSGVVSVPGLGGARMR